MRDRAKAVIKGASLALLMLSCTACATLSDARKTEAEAKRIATKYPAVEAIAADVYSGPAVMARYQGETKDGVYDGFGVLTLPDSGVVQAGLFRNGALNGPGVERDTSGQLLAEGVFVDGALKQ